MTQTATVKQLLPDGQAEIVVQRQSACGHDCAGCGGRAAGNAPQITATAANGAHAHPGDVVLVESESRQVLGLAAVLYLFPFLLLFAGYLLAAGPLGLGEGGSATLGFGCLLLGVGISFLLDRRLRRTGTVAFRITEVIQSCSDM